MEGLYSKARFDALERELSEALAAKEWAEAEVIRLSQINVQYLSQFTEALATQKRAEASRDWWKKKHREDNESLILQVQRLVALADARGRALENYANLDNWETDGSQGFRRWVGGGDGTEVADDALALTAPEALAAQQECEAGLLAQNEALRGALELVGTLSHSDDCDGSHEGWVEDTDDCSCGATPANRAVRQALALTPLAALAQQRERIAALERVYEVLSARWVLLWHTPVTEQEQAEVSALAGVATLDAERGQA